MVVNGSASFCLIWQASFTGQMLSAILSLSSQARNKSISFVPCLCQFVPVMFNQIEFVALVASAYQHLYDFVQLRTQPLADYLLAGAELSPKERGWRLHHLLLEVIEELSPGQGAPVHSREWRRHRIMVLRYVDALDPQQVADKLAISRRQYYREHAAAIEAIAAILWNRGAAVPALPDHTELLHSEMARITQSESRSDVLEVIEGVLALLKRILDDSAVRIELALPPRLPTAGMGRNLLRQVMMGLLGHLANHTRHGTLRFTAHTVDGSLLLRIGVQPPLTQPPQTDDEWFRTLADMLQHNQGSIALLADNDGQRFELRLPLDSDYTVLVVDDNADMLALYERYLTPNGYHVLATQHAATALELARQVQPFCAVLDLMMPEQDGWELLQNFVSQPMTAHIPVVICSVLKQRELALALGAAVFLDKPITEAALLGALAELKQMVDDDRRE